MYISAYRRLIPRTNQFIVRCYCRHVPWDGDYDLRLARELNEDKVFIEICEQYKRKLVKRTGVFVAQPFVRFKDDLLSTPDLRFQEAMSLVRSVPNWRVVDGGLFPVRGFQSPSFFSDKVISRLNDIILGNPLMDTLFVAVDRLLGHQQLELEKALSIPVIDRFSVILEIFRSHAQTGEAMLQIQLAEIPYLMSRIKEYHSAGEEKTPLRYGRGGKGQSDDPVQKYKRHLDERAKKIRNALDRIERHRTQIFQHRSKRDIPSIAVIGYTNSGKTSLIKAITNKNELEPEDRLFATLDVTAHLCSFPSFKNVALLDSIGFIANIPPSLITSFNTTFKDVASSDLLVHVYDISHPDLKNQLDTVQKTLKNLEIPQKLVDSMINIANKVDLIETLPEELTELVCPDHIRCSATELTNLNTVVKEIDAKLSKFTGRNSIILRVPNGGEELSRLYKDSKIISMTPDKDDANYLLVEVIMSNASKIKFFHHFGDRISLNES
ncbi:putative GTP-binding protein 6 [Brevipalpus obovatus]|uniref:putative GTP-binding protein 6 n=1 Tax=Brevipalpus obovatus TaxID=246614 RepID=UPI003D9F99AA